VFEVNGRDHRPPLVLTGERRDGHVLVRVRDQPLWLSYGHLCRLIRLVLARGLTPSGYVADPDVLYPQGVCRLRKAIDEAVGPGAGGAFIETGVGCEYRLAVPAREVALGPAFPELSRLGLVTAEELAKLQEFCRPCHRDVTAT
jgi:hypothetical protein